MVVTADLAADLRGLGSYEEALRHDEAVVHWLAEHPHLEDKPALRAHRSLAASLRALGRYEQAGQTDAAALARCQDTLGERHPQTLTTMTAHAWDLRLGGHHAEALRLQSAPSTDTARSWELTIRTPWPPSICWRSANSPAGTLPRIGWTRCWPEPGDC